MDFDPTPSQRELRDAVTAVLERECSIAGVRERIARGAPTLEPWKSATELGWTAIPIAERFGGLGLGFAELALVLEAHGSFLAPGPFLATLTQFAPLIREAGSPEQQQRFLGAVASGAMTGALAFADEAGSRRSDTAIRARREGSCWRLDGAAHYVIDGDSADEIALAACVESGDRVGLFVLPGSAVEIRSVESLDASRPVASVVCDGVEVTEDRVLGEPGACGAALDRTLEEATVALVCETVGTCHALFDRTLEYARQRVQFGRAIGSFQAIQHKFADLFAVLEKARSVALFAALTLAENDPRRTLATSMAKVAVGDCQRMLAKEAIQIHGGIGFTWEHDVHLFVKRIKAAELLLGTSSEHRGRIADLLGV